LELRSAPVFNSSDNQIDHEGRVDQYAMNQRMLTVTVLPHEGPTVVARRFTCEPAGVEAMSNHYHAVVWIDHREAKVFQFNATQVDRGTVRSTHPDQHIHHKANAAGSGHAPV